jgi:5-formyltetrahydrofolate cyclo-ligase
VNPPVPSDIRTWRKEQRTRLLAERMAMPLDDFRVASEAVLQSAVEYLPLDAMIGCYWPFRREPDCLPFMRERVAQGGQVALPVVIGRGQPLEFRLWTERTKMEAGVWEILHPAEGVSVTPSALLVPLLGFDDNGYRLGYGAGYYDATLASLSPRPFTVGVGFERARLATIHPQPHDIPLDAIVTEDRTRLFERH